MENNSTRGSCAGHCRGLGAISIGGATPIVTWCLAGRMEMSLVSMNGIPAKTSTWRFSTTKPSNENSWFAWVKDTQVSPTTFRGEHLSAWCAYCELGLR